MPTKKFRSACTQFKSRKTCKDPCKVVIKKIMDLKTGLQKNVMYCRTKYAHYKHKMNEKQKRFGKVGKTEKKRMQKMEKNIQDLEKVSAVAIKANEKVAEKASMMPKIPSVNDVTNTVSNVSDSISKTMNNLFSSTKPEEMKAPIPAVPVPMKKEEEKKPLMPM